MKRRISEVLEKVLEVVPEEREFRQALERVVYDAGYKPPEGEHICWSMGGKAFYERFGENQPTTGWAKRAVDLWLGTEEQS